MVKSITTLMAILGLTLGLSVGNSVYADDQCKEEKQTKVEKKQRPKRAMMEKADTDKDGKVSFEEMKALNSELTEEEFAKKDTNGDGFLTREDRPEKKGGKNKSGKEGGRMSEADTNSDGKVSFEEMLALNPELTEEDFAKKDTNDDGFITKEDVKGKEKSEKKGKRGRNKAGVEDSE